MSGMVSGGEAKRKPEKVLPCLEARLECLRDILASGVVDAVQRYLAKAGRLRLFHPAKQPVAIEVGDVEDGAGGWRSLKARIVYSDGDETRIVCVEPPGRLNVVYCTHDKYD